MKETIIRQYRKKPVIVEAVQLNHLNVPDVARWIGEDKAKVNLESDEAWKLGKAPPIFSVTICTLEGDMKAMPGDYIIKGVNGEFYPCKPDIFEKTYETVEQQKEENAMFKGKIDTQPSFGSIGDSISMDDYQTTTGPITGSTVTPINQEYCGYRLPCGICRMTMTQCPRQTVQITWTSQTATTEVEA